MRLLTAFQRYIYNAINNLTLEMVQVRGNQRDMALLLLHNEERLDDTMRTLADIKQLASDGLTAVEALRVATATAIAESTARLSADIAALKAQIAAGADQDTIDATFNSMQQVNANLMSLQSDLVKRIQGEADAAEGNTTGNTGGDTPPPPPAVALRAMLSPATLSLSTGQTGTMSTVMSDASAVSVPVSYASSDAAVATVDVDGNVAPVGLGATTITATDALGNTASASVSVVS